MTADTCNVQCGFEEEIVISVSFVTTIYGRVVITFPASKAISFTICEDYFSFRRDMTDRRLVGVSWYRGTVIDGGVRRYTAAVHSRLVWPAVATWGAG